MAESVAADLNSEQKARLVSFATPVAEFPVDRRPPEPVVDVVQKLLTTQYRVNAWIENGVGHEQRFGLQDEFHASFRKELEQQLIDKGFEVLYEDNSILVRYVEKE